MTTTVTTSVVFTDLVGSRRRPCGLTTAAWLGDVDAAGLLFERLSPFEAQGISTGANFNGIVGMYLARLAAVLGRREEALECFERADAQLRSLRAPFWHARNELDWARLLARDGTDEDLRHARELLAEATATATTYGCGGIERRASELAQSLA